MCLARFTIYSTHVISNEIHSHLLHLFLSGSGHGTRRNHYTRDALQKGSAPFAGETKCGALGSGLAIVDSARNPGRFDVTHPINLLSFTLA